MSQAPREAGTFLHAEMETGDAQAVRWSCVGTDWQLVLVLE